MSDKKIGFISLGCPKALVDSEQIITRLKAEEYEVSDNYQDSDLVIVNTCGFIDAAIEESLEAIGEALNENGRVIVTGCLGGKDSFIKDKYPNVLAVTGPNSLDQVMESVHEEIPPEHDPYLHLVPAGGIKLTPRHYAYLKISEGCNHDCSFCIIPDMRGRLDSRSVSQVLAEAESLVSAGVRELLVVSQDTSAYGLDKKYPTEFYQNQSGSRAVKTSFYDLAKELGQLDAWVRMHYVYPYPHVDKVIPLMAENIVLPYLDIPLQHANHDVLKSMKRPANQENMLKRIASWRDICPDITLRSTFIVGFPGETEAQFAELLDFIQEIQFDRVGAFAYSDVKGAQSNLLSNHVAEDVKQERLAKFMEVQAQISRNKLANRVGQTIRVIVDSEDDEGVIARSAADAPEIDGLVFVDNVEGTTPGDFLTVKIVDSSEHDLWGECV
ncbi:MAG: 30S ribosomal protein S12 methylthiotransferase RimO [Gammaproteobacteria bacterium]|nr:30S ribosomal protein S12 methylthiotransferase RimO [Gammaproteobacteria bacterium]